MMTLDEAIEHAEWCAENSCGECADDHAQLADWLRELRRARMEIDLLKTLRDGFKADVNKLKDENAKLRSERDHWHVEQVHAYGNWEDVHKYASSLKYDNNMMRKMMQGYVDDYTHDNCGSCYGGLCEDCDCWLSNSVDELRELGIEVSYE